MPDVTEIPSYPGPPPPSPPSNPKPRKHRVGPEYVVKRFLFHLRGALAAPTGPIANLGKMALPTWRRGGSLGAASPSWRDVVFYEHEGAHIHINIVMI